MKLTSKGLRPRVDRNQTREGYIAVPFRYLVFGQFTGSAELQRQLADMTREAVVALHGTTCQMRAVDRLSKIHQTKMKN